MCWRNQSKGTRMTKEDIIRMAREAGLFIAHDSEGQFSAVHDGEILDMYPDGDKERDRLYREKRFVEILGPFAKLVAAKKEAEMQYRINTLHAMYEQACKQRDELMDEQRSMVAAMRGRIQ